MPRTTGRALQGAHRLRHSCLKHKCTSLGRTQQSAIPKPDLALNSGLETNCPYLGLNFLLCRTEAVWTMCTSYMPGCPSRQPYGGDAHHHPTLGDTDAKGQIHVTNLSNSPLALAVLLVLPEFSCCCQGSDGLLRVTCLSLWHFFTCLTPNSILCWHSAAFNTVWVCIFFQNPAFSILQLLIQSLSQECLPSKHSLWSPNLVTKRRKRKTKCISCVQH